MNYEEVIIGGQTPSEFYDNVSNFEQRNSERIIQSWEVVTGIPQIVDGPIIGSRSSQKLQMNYVFAKIYLLNKKP